MIRWMMAMVFMLNMLALSLPALAASVAGRIVLAGGEVWVLKGDQTKVKAARGQVLEESDTVITGGNGRAKLSMVDGTVLFVAKNS
ncbi:MAG: hypothetical protein Q9M13_04040, partial [Mariprofundales bacterium]|nr:hypothetical protein [Mariprofundales bacterium]